jgi:hypothetical protein
MNWLDVIGRLMDVVKEEFKSMNAEESLDITE